MHPLRSANAALREGRVKCVERVEDIFETTGRGCIIVPGVPYSFEPKVGIGAAIEPILYTRKQHPLLHNAVTKVDFGDSVDDIVSGC